MTGLLATHNDVVLVGTDLAPLAGSDTGSLGETTKVSELSSRGDLRKGSTVTLSDDGEFTAIVTDPSPRARALSDDGTEVSVGEEVVQIDLILVSMQ